MIDLVAMINDGYDAKEAQQWPIYGDTKNVDRTAYVTASEVASCARKIKLDKAALLAGGYIPSEGTKNTSKIDWGFFERGHTMEAWAVDMLNAGNNGKHRLILTGKDQRTFIAGKQSGTPDGVFLIGDDGIFILEIKSFDPRTNVSKLPKAEHVAQVMQNADLVAHMMDKKALGGQILYIEASNWKRMFPFDVEFSSDVAGDYEARASWIMETPPDLLPPEGVFKRGCTYCAHAAECNRIERQRKTGELQNDKLSNAKGSFFG